MCTRLNKVNNVHLTTRKMAGEVQSRKEYDNVYGNSV